MATPIPTPEKNAFIDIVKLAPYPGGPNEASRLQDILVNYEDIYTAITRELDLFASNNSYLINGVTQFDDTELQAVGIYVNKSQIPPLTDPVLIINSSYDEIILTIPSPMLYKTLCILGPSTVKNIVLDAGVTLNELWIGPGATVDLVDGANVIVSPLASPPTVVQKIYLPFAKSTPSKLNAVTYGSVVNQIVKEEGSYYGGVKSNNPDIPCADVVTGITATEITKNSVFVSWAPPTSYLFINVFYRKTNSNVWMPVGEEDGEYTGDTGFTFRRLESDTFYDVQISVKCTNGGVANNSITFQTTCCGAGTQMSLYKNCPITMLISSTPDSPALSQVLCNGVSIALHYPPGPTITIPYLASVNCSILQPFIIDNANYQLMPYNPTTGTWDASTTPVLTFVEGNVVTVNVSIPA